VSETSRGTRRPRERVGAALAVALVLAPTPPANAYTKPGTLKISPPSALIFPEQYQNSPHTWTILQAVALLKHDGFVSEYEIAHKYMLPMLLGATYNDVWGDADLGGGSVLDYYCPDRPDQNYGYGRDEFGLYQNSTEQFAAHPLFRYGNAAEHAQFRYGYAVRTYLGFWGTDARDYMAGWVVDRVGGQDDPITGLPGHPARWANGAAAINAQPRFGGGHSPREVLLDLKNNYSDRQVIFDDPERAGNELLSTLFVPKGEVVKDHGPEWLDDHYGDADDIEAYMGFDGVDSAAYANWTTDAGDDDNSSPFIFYAPVSSPEHSFFQLGWAMHLVDDNTLMVHTVDGGVDAYRVHNRIEAFADKTLSEPTVYNHREIRLALPALDPLRFEALYPYPPPPTACQPPNPAEDYKPRWYADSLAREDGEGFAHAYVRNAALIAHKYWPFVNPSSFGSGCIDTERDADWDHMGFFTVLELDLAIKANAGLIHQFLADVGANDRTPPTVALNASVPGSSTFSGVASDAGSFIASIEYSLDGGDWLPAATDPGTVASQTEGFSVTIGPVPDGTHTVAVRATDVSGNTTPASEYGMTTFLTDTTPPVITIHQPQPRPYVHSATLVLGYGADDGAGSGVASVVATLDGVPTLAGHGLASGQVIPLLREMSLGPHTFTVEATDNVGLSATNTVEFTVIVTPESIKEDLAQLAPRHAQLLLLTLEVAAGARARGHCGLAGLIYQLFVFEVRALTGRVIPAAAASILIADASYLIAHCP
jgi:hypothetical protein